MPEPQSRDHRIPLDGDYRQTLERMAEILVDCSRDDWDGDGAAAASTASFLTAKRFLEALPPSLQSPEVSLDPDGEMVFEWSGGPQHTFSISFGAGGKLSYAGLLAGETTHGVEDIACGVPRDFAAKIRP